MKKGLNKRWLGISIAVFLVIITGLVIALTQSKWLSNHNSTPDQPETNPIASNTNPIPKTNPVASNTNPMPTPTLSPLPQSTPSSITKTAVPEQINLTGTWSGKQMGLPATIVINGQEGDSLNGTLSAGGYLISISGRINQNTRQVTLQETRVLKTSGQKNHYWSLGTNTGSISSDGSVMSGKGKDKAGVRYSWSFAKK